MDNKDREALERINLLNQVEILRALKDRFGPEVSSVVERVTEEQVRKEWVEIGRKEKSNTLEDLVRLIWEPIREIGYEFTIEKYGDETHVICTNCPTYNRAKELGVDDWIYQLVCCGDPFIAEGFNPELGLRFEKTPVNGDICCHQVYFRKKMVAK